MWVSEPLSLFSPLTLLKPPPTQRHRHVVRSDLRMRQHLWWICEWVSLWVLLSDPVIWSGLSLDGQIIYILWLGMILFDTGQLYKSIHPWPVISPLIYLETWVNKILFNDNNNNMFNHVFLPVRSCGQTVNHMVWVILDISPPSRTVICFVFPSWIG